MPGRIPDDLAQAPVEILTGEDGLVVEVLGIGPDEGCQVMLLDEPAERRIPLVGARVERGGEEVLAR